MKVLPLPRGTTFAFLVRLKDGNGGYYEMGDGDKLILGVKHYLEHKNYEFSKTLTYENYDQELKGYIFKLQPQDTMNFCFDNYYMDVGLQTSDGDFYCIVPTHILKVMPMVSKFEVASEPEPEPEPEPDDNSEELDGE